MGHPNHRARGRGLVPLLCAALSGACGEPSLVRIVDKPPGATRYAPRDTALATVHHLDPLEGSATKIVVGATVDIDLSRWPADGGADRDRFTRGGSIPATRYLHDGEVAVPGDYASLALYTAYAHVETARRELVAAGASELEETVPVYFEPDLAHAHQLGLPTHDNALYFPTLDALVLLPMQALTEVPFGMNRGVIAHELAHRAFYYAAWDGALFATQETHAAAPGAQATVNRLRALDEGVADYFGAFVADDPDFLAFSTPAAISAARRLDSQRVLDPSWVSGTAPTRPDGSFEPFAVGSVVSHALWRIGVAEGHARVATAVLDAQRAIALEITSSLSYGHGDFERALVTALPIDARETACSVFQETHNTVWTRIAAACP